MGWPSLDRVLSRTPRLAYVLIVRVLITCILLYTYNSLGRVRDVVWCALRCHCGGNWACKPGACCRTADSILSVNGDTAGPAGGAFDMVDTLDEGRHEGVSDTL